MFRKRKGIKVSYNRQGLICFLCLDYKNEPREIQEKIRRLCDEAGGEYAAALFEFMTTDRSAVAICRKHNISDMTLYRARKRFYERWGEK